MIRNLSRTPHPYSSDDFVVRNLLHPTPIICHNSGRITNVRIGFIPTDTLGANPDSA